MRFFNVFLLPIDIIAGRKSLPTLVIGKSPKQGIVPHLKMKTRIIHTCCPSFTSSNW
jgi:hypothetical protein